MLISRKILWKGILIACFLSLSSSGLMSEDISFFPIKISGLTRYTENRIAFQHIQEPWISANKFDNSLASLLIIKDNKVYLFRDGYDDATKVKTEAYIMELRRELPKDLWVNKINSKPDYIKITERKADLMLNITEDFVEKNFGDFYRNIRNSFINKHLIVFRNLMRDRVESGLYIKRTPLSPPAFKEVKEASKYSISISAKSNDDLTYFAEDADGDDVTETFYVTTNDGFTWGYGSGPNIILIHNNKEEDIKQLIGKLCHEAFYGTTEEENMILKTFPKANEIIDTFNLEQVTMQPVSKPEPNTTN